MDKADLAIAISLISAVSSVASAGFAGWLAWNDSKRLRRKAPVAEFTSGRESDQVPGWNDSHLTIRNLENVALLVTAIETTGRNGSINSWDEACTGYNTGFGEPQLKSSLPDKRKTEVHVEVGPMGTAPSPHGLQGGSTARLRMFTKGVRKSTDLKMTWRWADDQK